MPPSFNIESGIAMPSRGSCLIGPAGEPPLKDMKIGDSFLWNGHPQLAYRSAKRSGITIAARKINGEGTRYWRVK